METVDGIKLQDLDSVYGLTYIAPRKYDGSLPDVEGSWSYGDWDSPADRGDCSWAIIDLTMWSDYSGSTVERANCDAIRSDYPQLVCTIFGGYGTEGLMIPLDLPLPEYFVDALHGLADYPLYDDEAHSQLEMNLADEAWSAYLRADLQRDLVDAVSALMVPQGRSEAIGEDLVFDLSDADWDRIRELYYGATYEAPYGPEAESAVDVHFPFDAQICASLARRLATGQLYAADPLQVDYYDR